jgi:hypothetical protein
MNSFILPRGCLRRCFHTDYLTYDIIMGALLIVTLTVRYQRPRNTNRTGKKVRERENERKSVKGEKREGWCEHKEKGGKEVEEIIEKERGKGGQ